MKSRKSRRRNNKDLSYNSVLDHVEMDFEKFHESTKMHEFPSDIITEDILAEWIKISYKSYQRLDKIVLPDPLPLFPDSISLKQILISRQSKRIFGLKSVGVNKLSPLLYFSVGLKNRRKLQVPQRFYPSGGGRYPLEIYIIALKTDLPKGVYHYNVMDHVLEELVQFGTFDFHKYFHQEWGKKAAFIVVMTAIFERNTVKYKDRGYRHVLSETGHVGQNFYLNSTALNISCSSIGGYKEEELNTLLDIDGKKETVIYAMAFGSS